MFIRSGIRFDYLINDKDDTFFYELCKHHVSGQLKVAPKHISDNVLKYMGKPENSVFNKFSDKFYKINEKIGKKQYLVPYLISSHPGSTIRDAVRLAEYLHGTQYKSATSTRLLSYTGNNFNLYFWTGIDPFIMKKVYVPKTLMKNRYNVHCCNTEILKITKLVYEAPKIGKNRLNRLSEQMSYQTAKGDILSNNQKKNREE